MAGDDGRRYTFGPLERRGLFMGFQASQLAVVGAACLLAVAVMRVGRSPVAGAAGATVVVAGVAGACCRIHGRVAAAWLPVVGTWLWRRRRQPTLDTGHPQRCVVARGRALVAASPTGHAAEGLARWAGTRQSALRDPSDADGPRRSPMALARLGVTIVPMPGSDGHGPAVIRDRHLGTSAAVLVVRGAGFPLLDADDKSQRLAAWGAALAALGREGSPVHRLQWIERSRPGVSDGLLAHLDDAGGPDGAHRRSYARLVDAAGTSTEDHEVLLVLAVRGRRGGGRARSGLTADGPVGLLRREVQLLESQLAAAELVVDSVLDEAGLAERLAGATGAAGRGRRRAVGRPASAWAHATDDGWGTFRTDGWWHSTYWIAEWPRLEVGPDFLSPVLLAPGVCRTVSVTMAPVGPARAARQVEAARTADLADDELRRRAGFLTTARRQREAEAVLRRSAELVEGHAEYRFAGYVTVSAMERGLLDTGCAEVEQSASQAHLELRRLYGQQEEAFTWTLPLARGVT